MTVTYTSEVSTSRGISCFLKLLARWRGSIYKIVWADLLLFLGLYYAINFTYRFFLNAEQIKQLENVIQYCDKYASLIPLSFVLGFYVNLIMTRWWSQYSSIPFPDNLSILVGASVKGQDDRARIVRRTIVRYICVGFTITMTMLSSKVKKRFPTLDHFIEAGLITRAEKKIMEDLDQEFPSYSKYWLPLAWASNVVTRARHEGLIRDDESVNTILQEINLFRSKLGGMLDYDWISVPLVYTQVVTLAVYSYFMVAAIGKQDLDIYFPVLPVLEFFFYMGWLKVAETLINPYGEDDDDFEVVWMIDRHLQVCYLIVDKIHQEHPKLLKDPYWYETAPNSLPYTVASQNYMQEYPFPSTQNLKIKKNDQDLVIPEDDSTDGARRSGAYLWRLHGKHFFNQRNSNTRTHLKKVVTFQDKRDNGFEEVNEYDDNLTKIHKKTHEVHCEEFEQLKTKRAEERHSRLLKLLELRT